MLAAGLLALPLRGTSAAQSEPIGVAGEIHVGSELEAYARYLSTLGSGGRYPWSIRGFSPREVDAALGEEPSHPWADRFDLSSRPGAVARLDPVRPEWRSWYNSAFPYGGNDGAVWVGRGVTTALRAGFSAGLGPLSLVVRPEAFWAQNGGFDLPGEASGAITDFQRIHGIDLPYRFGDEPYSRVDPGESTLRLDLAGLSAGISTASQAWGPAAENPLILGANGGGFAHAFAGTSAPVDLWIGRVHARLTWGRLDQSGFSPVQAGELRRFAAGAVGVFQPRGLEGLELGAARFVNSVWPEGGPGTDDLLRPFDGIFKVGLDNVDLRPENHLASVFVRVAPPRTGFEVYGEFVRDDYPTDPRHLILEPDDLSGYMVGMRKAWPRAGSRLLAVRAEVLNTETSHRERGDRQQKIPLYQNVGVRQGHTQRGQLLAAASGFGGAGSVLATDLFHPGGRWSVEWRRSLEEERGGAFDVSHALSLGGLWFAGRFDVSAEAAAVYNLNRYFRGDVLNLRAMLGLRTAL